MPTSYTCIYCGHDGPFNVEHAIPAGLGAGNALVLDGLVCKACNDFFSRDLEVRVLRRGEIGLGRLALQPHGRSRGGKTKAPTFESTSAKLLTEDGRALEVKLGSGLAPEILPQLTLDGDQLEGNGSDRTKVAAFLQRLGRVLGDRVELLTKRVEAEKSLTFVQLVWSSNGYVPSSESAPGKPGRDTIWMEPPQAETGGRARMLERHNGSLVVQVHEQDVDAAASLATMIRHNLSKLTQQLSTLVHETDIPQPQIRVSGHSPTDEDLARLTAKIGFNLLALEQGREFCRAPRFDAVRTAIRTGSPQLRMSPWTEKEGLLPKLHQLFAGKHWMMLSPMPNPRTGARGLVFCSSLYGGVARIVSLTDDLPDQYFDFHVFYVVDYQRQSVSRHTLLDVVKMLQRAPSSPPAARAAER